MVFAARTLQILSLWTCSAVITNAYNIGQPKTFVNTARENNGLERRRFLQTLTASVAAGGAGLVSVVANPTPAHAAAAAIQDSLDVDTFIRTGQDIGGNMGVSSQAGKSRPQTGVVFRDGSEVLQDSNGNVFAELLTGTKANPVAVLASFSSPWKLEKGPVFDVECRDGKTGDGAFLAVTRDVQGKSIGELSNEVLLERLFDPTGRFSFYGTPTDVKVKSSRTQGNYRFLELGFSNLSQSTNSEIPRKALLVATIPEGTNNAVLLVGSASASRWKSGADKKVKETVESFRAIPAPKTGMKLRARPRGPELIDF